MPRIRAAIHCHGCCKTATGRSESKERLSYIPHETMDTEVCSWNVLYWLYFENRSNQSFPFPSRKLYILGRVVHSASHFSRVHKNLNASLTTTIPDFHIPFVSHIQQSPPFHPPRPAPPPLTSSSTSPSPPTPSKPSHPPSPATTPHSTTPSPTPHSPPPHAQNYDTPYTTTPNSPPATRDATPA